MKTLTRYSIARTVEGSLDAVIAAEAAPAVDLADVLASMRELAFIVETVAHLQGKEAELLPTAQRARALIAVLSGEAEGFAPPAAQVRLSRDAANELMRQLRGVRNAVITGECNVKHAGTRDLLGGAREEIAQALKTLTAAGVEG